MQPVPLAACALWRRREGTAPGRASAPGPTPNTEGRPTGEAAAPGTARIAPIRLHSAPEQACGPASRYRPAWRPGDHTIGARTRRFLGAGIPRPRGGDPPPQSHLLLADYDLQTIQKLLGHSDIKTTMIYLQTVPGVTLKEAKSPLDL